MPIRAAGALFLGAALAMGCTGSPYRPAAADAATIYLEACVSCHQGGPNGPSLAGRHLSAEVVEKRLSRGGRGMPAFPHIRGEARANLVSFIVRLSGDGGTGSPPSP
jgi:mono/diheme cytochrome c family protein